MKAKGIWCLHRPQSHEGTQRSSVCCWHLQDSMTSFLTARKWKTAAILATKENSLGWLPLGNELR